VCRSRRLGARRRLSARWRQSGREGAKKAAERARLIDRERLVPFRAAAAPVVGAAHPPFALELRVAELADGRRIAVRASGTEPKAKFYSFTKAEVTDADDLIAARERARKSALALRAWLETDAKRRAR
jgi:phosphomannomutase